jgi:hypothetical protein
MLFKILSANTNEIRKKLFFLRKEMILYLFGGLSLGGCYLPSASRYAPEFEDVMVYLILAHWTEISG